MKNEYISREAAIDAVLSYNGYFQDQLSTNNMILKMEAEVAIDDVPAADVVEVVRCKDCVFYRSATGFCHYHSKEYDGGEYWDKFGSDDFCSRGERMCDNG